MAYEVVSFPTKPPLPSVRVKRMFSLLQGVIAPHRMQFCELPEAVMVSKVCRSAMNIADGDQAPHLRQRTSARLSIGFMAMGVPVVGRELVRRRSSHFSGRPPVRNAEH